MRLVICCNHSPPHIGGSEKVVQQIAESMAASPYNHEVIVLSHSLHKILENAGVRYEPCPKTPEAFLAYLKLLKPGHVHIYSDCFHEWFDLLEESNTIPCHKSIALVGMNVMRKKIHSIPKLKGKKDD